MIREEDGKFCLYSKDGEKKLGCYDTRIEAEEREKEILVLEHAKENMMELEIFKAGTYRGKDFSKDFIDAVAKNYDPSLHEAPAVVGHPRENAPAYGWVKSVKVVGDTLVAELDDETLDKQFVELVNGGKFKKRSASFYMDLNGKGPYLRHVGFLGAQPPEVKGLKDVQFKESGQVLEIEMTEHSHSVIGNLFRRLRDWMIEKEGVEAADKILFDYDIKLLETEEGQCGETYLSEKTQERGKETMTEEQIQKIREEERKKIEVEFSEKLKAKEREVQELKEKDAARGKEARKKEVHDFCEKQKSEGKLIPAWQKAGIEEFLERLDDLSAGENGNPAIVEFGEKKEKKSLRQWFEGFLVSLPKVIELGELGKGNVGGGDRDALIQDFMEKKKVSYKEAAIAVAKEHPELFQ